MARGYRISDEAKSDLDDIWLYIARHNPTAAAEVIDACFEEFEGLSSQPGLGHQRPDTPGGCRSWVVPRFQNYVIVYRVGDAGPLEIARVLHGYQDFPEKFKS